VPALAFVALLSFGLLAGALLFQYVMGLPPCKLCIVQRYPHFAAMGLAVLGLGLGAAGLARARLADLRAAVLGLAGAALLYTGGYGIYHTGAERGWWPGPADCTGAGVLPDSLAALNALSMASWNALLSIGAALLVLGVAALYLKARLSPALRAGAHG
jgi:disulfide bond formation protein DsbB